MTPGEMMLFIEGWNRAQGGADDAPTADEYAELVRKYG